MKRFYAILLLLVLGGLSMVARDREEELALLKSDLVLTYGNNDIVRMDVPALTKAPKGYEPFHISHYGRHGSRWAWDSNTYKFVAATLENAAATDNLTDLGKALWDAYKPFRDECLPHTGELTRKGWNQHMEIARVMYSAYPKIFSNNPSVDAASSLAHRAIMSMSAFCVSLAECRQGMDIYEQVTPELYCEIIPDSYLDPYRIPKQEPLKKQHLAGYAEWRSNAYDWEGTLSKIFVDTRAATPDPHKFVYELYISYVGRNSLDKEYEFPDVFTEKDMLTMYNMECANAYRESANMYNYSALLEALLRSVETASASSRPSVRLRFGHDYVFQMYLPLCGINDFGRELESLDDAFVYYPLREVPMGANIQFVFYRKKAAKACCEDDVIFKVVLNGVEASLPIESLDGPYYRWTDYKAYIQNVLSSVVK